MSANTKERPPSRSLFREGDRVRSMRTRETGYVRERRSSERLGERYLVDWDGGLEYSLVRPIELELIWPADRGGTGEVWEANEGRERKRSPTPD